MDYNFSNENEGPTNSPERNSRFGQGLLLGILIGLVFTLCASIAFVAIYTRNNGYLLIGENGAEKVEKNRVLDDDTAEKIQEVTSFIDLYYNGEVKDEDLRNSMVKGMVEGLGDPYSVYYSPEEYKELQVSTTGTYYGIGAGLNQDTKTMKVTITKIYKGTPSEEAGLKKDDIILYVDDIDATSMELNSLVQKIRGEEGTSVHIKVYRPSTKENLEFDVERRNVELPSIESQMLDNKIGYIQISEFQKNTADQFNKAFKELQDKGMKSLIVDVRDNPGGLLSGVAEILDTILPEGLTVYTEDKYGKRDEYKSDASCIDLPMVVLVNGNSASASEIFAGAIKDYKYGTLIGTKTFGKGIVQTIFPLSDSDAVKVTTAKYFTPKGNFIHGVGISPDIELEYEYSGDKNKSYEMKYDNQLQKAIEVLNDKMGN